MLSYNVATLLRSAPGTERRYPVENLELEIAEDLRLAEPIEGEVRLSRTGRSILARAHLTTAIDGVLQPLPQAGAGDDRRRHRGRGAALDRHRHRLAA